MHNTDELFMQTPQPQPEPAAVPPVPAGTTRLIDVHIYDLPAQEEEETAPVVTADTPTEPQDQDPPDPQRPLSRRKVRPWLLLGVALCLLASSTLVVMFVWFPLLTPTAMVTIVPVKMQIETSSTITVVSGQPSDPQQLAGRALTPIVMSQQQTIPTTGKGHQDATAAHGTITFYNAATTPQLVTAGTLVTGKDGVQIVTDQDARVAAATYPTFGQATVPAHAVIAGPGGNITAGDIYGPCCRLNLSAVNSTFTGGQPARDYQTVTAQDIENVATTLKTNLDQSIHTAISTQVHQDETLITPLDCTQQVIPDQQTGAEAAQVNITITETCHPMAYPTQAYQHLMTQIITQSALKQLGNGYHLTGDSNGKVIKVTPKDHGAVDLLVHVTGTEVYQFTQQQQAYIIALLAGKSKVQAIKTLLDIPGVQSVSITLSNGNTTLPTDRTHIHLLFLVMP